MEVFHGQKRMKLILGFCIHQAFFERFDSFLMCITL